MLASCMLPRVNGVLVYKACLIRFWLCQCAPLYYEISYSNLFYFFILMICKSVLHVSALPLLMFAAT